MTEQDIHRINALDILLETSTVANNPRRVDAVRAGMAAIRKLEALRLWTERAERELAALGLPIADDIHAAIEASR